MQQFTKHPEAVKLIASINDKNAAADSIKAAIGDCEAQIADGQPADLADNRVAAAMHFAKTGEVNRPGGELRHLHEKHSELRQQREALQASIKADQQALMNLQSLLSAQASAEVEQAHKAIASDALTALQAFEAACERESALVNKLSQNGYDPRFKTWVNAGFFGRFATKSESAGWHHATDLARYTGAKL